MKNNEELKADNSDAFKRQEERADFLEKKLSDLERSILDLSHPNLKLMEEKGFSDGFERCRREAAKIARNFPAYVFEMNSTERKRSKQRHGRIAQAIEGLREDKEKTAKNGIEITRFVERNDKDSWTPEHRPNAYWDKIRNEWVERKQ